MAPCGLFFWLVIVLLVIAGISYILGIDKLGEFSLDLIRLMIMLILITFLIIFILILIGRLDWGEIIEGFRINLRSVPILI